MTMDVLVTGIGLVSSIGEGIDAHLGPAGEPRAVQPVVDTERMRPRALHPLSLIDWSAQIPKKDQRQMETWQRLGVFAAGLALDDAGITGEDARSHIDMIVSAGGGERDLAVDAMAMDRARGLADPEPTLNEILQSELRPTLFLAQLSNLVAGNISIVHKVTGSSRTFMGEEGAGVSAVQTAAARIRAGQSEISLVGGGFSAERPDLFLHYELGGLLHDGDWRPVFSRGEPGGLVPGSVGAFLVLESRAHAESRGATAYARIAHVAGDRGPRTGGMLEKRFDTLLAESGAVERDLLVLSGATGLSTITAAERRALAARYPDAAVRAYGSLVGHSFEAHFTAGLALAAAALSRGTAPLPFAGDAEEHAATFAPKSALVTTVGHVRGEGVCVLETVR